MYPKGCSLAFEALMKETPYNHYDSGCDGICPECRSCRFHRPYWKYQSCVFEECPYYLVPVSTRNENTYSTAARKEKSNGEYRLYKSPSAGRKREETLCRKGRAHLPSKGLQDLRQALLAVQRSGGTVLRGMQNHQSQPKTACLLLP